MTIAMDGHIVVDDRGVPRIAGSRSRVVDVVMERQANGWSAEQIQEQHPHLSLAHVYAALAYYYAHQQELDVAIERGATFAESLRQKAGESPLVKRLRAEGKLP